MVKVAHADLLMVRQFSLRAADDPKDPGGLKNPGLMMDTVLGRLRLCETGLRIVERAWDIQHITKFCKAILDAIVEEVSDPRERMAIAERIHELNQEYNMTLNAGGRPPV